MWYAKKEERKVREEKLVDVALAPADIKALREKKKLHQEDNFDDCGGDLGPLGDIPFVNAFVVHGSPNFAKANGFLDNSAFCSDSAESSEDEFEKVLNDNYSLHCFLGYDGAGRHVVPPEECSSSSR